MRNVFLLSVVPGILVILLLTFGLQPPTTKQMEQASVSPFAWGSLDGRLRALIVAAGSLSLATMPEVFLVLWAMARGVDLVWAPLLWAAASAVKVVVAIPGGHWSDRFGRLTVLVAGWGLRIAILVAIGLTVSGGLVVRVLFLAYAGSLAFVEGPERALIGDYAPEGQKATAFGVYHIVVGLLALPGALLFGSLWQWMGESTAFLTAASLTGLSVGILVGLASTSRSS